MPNYTEAGLVFATFRCLSAGILRYAFNDIELAADVKALYLAARRLPWLRMTGLSRESAIYGFVSENQKFLAQWGLWMTVAMAVMSAREQAESYC